MATHKITDVRNSLVARPEPGRSFIPRCSSCRPCKSGSREMEIDPWQNSLSDEDVARNDGLDYNRSCLLARIARLRFRFAPGHPRFTRACSPSALRTWTVPLPRSPRFRRKHVATTPTAGEQRVLLVAEWLPGFWGLRFQCARLTPLRSNPFPGAPCRGQGTMAAPDSARKVSLDTREAGAENWWLFAGCLPPSRLRYWPFPIPSA